MTAEPLTTPERHWPVPPEQGWTVDDLLTLPDLPPHTELIDGSLVFVSPQRDFHSTVIDLLVNGLRRTAPPAVRVRREMTVVIDRRNGPEPDISVVRAEAVTGPDLTHFFAADVLLAVEVVSPDSEARDKEAKPRKYAAAGIPHFWLVEPTAGSRRPVVRVYELDPLTKQYELRGTHRELLKFDGPFMVDIDLADIDHL